MNRQRLMAIFMLVCFAFAIVASVLGMVWKNETLAVGGFAVIMAVFLYSWSIKKQRDRYYEEQRLKKLEEEAKGGEGESKRLTDDAGTQDTEREE